MRRGSVYVWRIGVFHRRCSRLETSPDMARRGLEYEAAPDLLDPGSWVENEHLSEAGEKVALEVLAVTVGRAKLGCQRGPGNAGGLSEVAVSIGQPDYVGSRVLAKPRGAV